MTAVTLNAAAIKRYRKNPDSFVDECLINPETGRPFDLYESERVFLRCAFQLNKNGRLLFPLLMFCAIKKSGKTVFGAIFVLVLMVLFAERFAEAFCCANDLEQSKSRVFEMCVRIVKASPLLKRATRILSEKIEFTGTGATIVPIAGDYTGAAGAHPSITVFDELWGYTTERERRLWDEHVPVPTRKISCRLVVSHAGFENESELLHDLYRRGLRQAKVAKDLYAGEGQLMFWSHTPISPLQTDEWLEQMRRELRPHQYLRMIENKFVTSQDTFIPPEWYERAVDENLTPLTIAKSLPVFVAVDASVNRDSTAIIALTYDREREEVRVIWHKIFTPTDGQEIDFEIVYETIGRLCNRFDVKIVAYDPFQMEAVAQRLARANVPMEKLKQTTENLTAFGSCLYDLLKSKKIRLYADEDIRIAMSRCVAIETTRGWKISKEKASHHIDIVVALAMACHVALEGQLVPQHFDAQGYKNMKAIMTSGRMHSRSGWAPAEVRAARMAARIGERRYAMMTTRGRRFS
jgi:hypothetical protein